MENRVEMKFPIVQFNGCRQIGPPRKFIGELPGKDSELFVCRIPKTFTEIELMPILEKFGEVFQFRLMMDYSNMNRGYGYVVYQSPDQATKALELIPHHITNSGVCLDVKRSYDKCRLFVGNLPRDLDSEVIKNTLQRIYPDMCNFIIHTRPNDGYKNRGFAFIDFPNHQAALISKKKHGSGALKLWERDIKVVWAKEERVVDPDIMTYVKTLFIRNIAPGTKARDFEAYICKFVSKQDDLVKCTLVRDFAFVEFTTKAIALNARDKITQTKFKGNSLSAEWALPPSSNGIHDLRKLYDYDSLLKIKCVANDWNMPIFIFGRLYHDINIQYVAVVVRNSPVECVILMEINTVLVPNVHQRAAEVMVKLIERCKGLPAYNLIIKTHGNDFKILGFTFESNLNFRLSETEFVYDLNEIVELAYAAHIICQTSPRLLHFSYQQALSFSLTYSYIHSIGTPHRILGCIPLTYRRSPPWQTKGNYPDYTILLALCDKGSRTNYQYPENPIRLPVAISALDSPERWNLFFAVNLSVVKSTYISSEIYFGALPL
ncbi:probable RNA-binding protein 46 [Phlebotomus papatasi]|uniref:probable RNA-binding protein 46 n=1 Tax=Phlebotomus papatasi TaxID=29031 RepID=UPI0024833744|nr:probable RNA-binding protein 46 [Phlebotomus papatasi]